MACTARRFTPQQEADIVGSLMNNPLLSDDPQLPLLVWWAMEDCNRRDTLDVVRFQYPINNLKLADFFNERVARRLMSGNIQRGTTRIATLFELAKDKHALLVAVPGMSADASSFRVLGEELRRELGQPPLVEGCWAISS